MDWTPVVRKCTQSCVLVQITGIDSLHTKSAGNPSSKSENGITTLSASGVIVDGREGLIVTSGSIIIPFLTNDNVTKLPKDNHTLLPGTSLNIMVHESDQNENVHKWEECTLLGVWACESVGQCVRHLNTEFQYRLETGWNDLNESEGRERDVMSSISTVEFLAVVRLNKVSGEMKHVTFGNSNELLLGQPIVIISTPFGCISPIAFFNSVTAGVVSHSLFTSSPRGVSSPNAGEPGNKSADLLLVDARNLPGTEGGGVFDASGRLIGLVTPRIMSSEKPMDMNFIVASNRIADLLLANININTNINININTNMGRITEGGATGDTFLPRGVRDAKKSIVCLQVGNTWASGILVSTNGHILTNAHLFKSSISEITRPTPISFEEYKHLKVKAFFNKPTKQVPATKSTKQHLDTTKQYVFARVEYISHNHLDIALLQVEKTGIEEVNQFVSPVKTAYSVDTAIGMPVWVIAHGFAPENGMEVVSSQGLLSNVILRDGVPASLQTSASVHSGNSGGMLVNSNGDLVGMVMSHATHKGTHTFTQLNFSVPYQQFITLINYANGEDTHAIQRLQNQPTDNFLASLWKFLPEPKEPPKKLSQNFMKFMEQMKTGGEDNISSATGNNPVRSIPRSKL